MTELDEFQARSGEDFSNRLGLMRADLDDQPALCGERAVQLFGIACVAPRRTESPARIELLHAFGQSDALAVDRGLSRSRPCIELSRDGLRERIIL